MNQQKAEKLELAVRFLGELNGIVDHADVFAIMAELQALKATPPRHNDDAVLAANRAIRARDQEIERLNIALASTRAMVAPVASAPFVPRLPDASPACASLHRGILIAMAQEMVFEAAKMGSQ